MNPPRPPLQVISSRDIPRLPKAAIISPRRIAARQRTSRIIEIAAGVFGARNVAKSLGIELPRLAQWADVDDVSDEGMIPLADVMAARGDFARAVLVAVLVTLDEGDGRGPSPGNPAEGRDPAKPSSPIDAASVAAHLRAVRA